MQILVGNTFPMSLIRRECFIVPVSSQEFKQFIELENPEIVSFWGHKNTIRVVYQIFNIDVTPIEDRPVLRLSSNRLPYYMNKEWKQVYVISPTYKADVGRPDPKIEVTPDMIKDWQILKIAFI